MNLKPFTTRFILNSDELTNVLNELIETSETIFISAAWVTHITDSYKLLLKHKNKISHFFCGISEFITTPQVLKDFALPFEHFSVVNDTKLFHHKCLIFKLKDKNGVFTHTVLQGSANLTYSGLHENYEIMQMTHFNSLIDLDEKLHRLLKPASVSVDISYILDYERRYEKYHARQSQIEAIRDQLATNFGDISFDEYLKFYDRYIHLEQRVALLDYFKGLLQKSSFHELELMDRKKIAGLYQGKDNLLLDSRWFGSMRRATHFYAQVENHPELISNAIKLIPQDGPVTELDYHNFCSAMINASGYNDDPIGIVTRMLAMIRPDYFLCITSQNKQAITQDFAIKSSELSLGNYWELITMPLTQSPWWKSDRPQGLAGKIWDYRVALLDCIYYEPRKTLGDVWEGN
jgi:HKD family nuclease